MLRLRDVKSRPKTQTQTQTPPPNTNKRIRQKLVGSPTLPKKKKKRKEKGKERRRAGQETQNNQTSSDWGLSLPFMDTKGQHWRCRARVIPSWSPSTHTHGLDRAMGTAFGISESRKAKTSTQVSLIILFNIYRFEHRLRLYLAREIYI